MNITPQAVSALKAALEQYNHPGSGIHVFNVQGCCGPSIQMEISELPGAEESVLSIEDIDFFVEKGIIDAISDVTIEYGEKGFRLNDPKRSGGGCGC